MSSPKRKRGHIPTTEQTPFHFQHFPASLPRIVLKKNTQKPNISSSSCEDDVDKHRVVLELEYSNQCFKNNSNDNNNSKKNENQSLFQQVTGNISVNKDVMMEDGNDDDDDDDEAVEVDSSPKKSLRKHHKRDWSRGRRVVESLNDLSYDTCISSISSESHSPNTYRSSSLEESPLHPTTVVRQKHPHPPPSSFRDVHTAHDNVSNNNNHELSLFPQDRVMDIMADDTNYTNIGTRLNFNRLLSPEASKLTPKRGTPHTTSTRLLPYGTPHLNDSSATMNHLNSSEGFHNNNNSSASDTCIMNSLAFPNIKTSTSSSSRDHHHHHHYDNNNNNTQNSFAENTSPLTTNGGSSSILHGSFLPGCGTNQCVSPILKASAFLRSPIFNGTSDKSNAMKSKSLMDHISPVTHSRPLISLNNSTHHHNNLPHLSNNNTQNSSSVNNSTLSTTFLSNSNPNTSFHSTSTINTKRIRPIPDLSAFDGTTNATKRHSFVNPSPIRAVSTPQKSMLPDASRLDSSKRTPLFESISSSNSQLCTTKILALSDECYLDNYSFNGSFEEDYQSSLIFQKKGHNSNNMFRPIQIEGAVSNDAHDCNNKGNILLSSSTPFNNRNGNNHCSAEGEDEEKLKRSSSEPQPLRSDKENADHHLRQRKRSDPSDTIVFANDFENLGRLGSGAFADVYKARSKKDKKVYAVKRNRRQFRGRRDRELALKEVHTMQRLQGTIYCIYLIKFFQAWQEDGYFFCQTELCSKNSCRHLILSLTTDWGAARRRYPSLEENLSGELYIPQSVIDGVHNEELPPSMFDESVIGRLMPESTIWKICQNVACGLAHIHAHHLVHHDIKPSNIFLSMDVFGRCVCKIGDFGMTGEINSKEDGQEGDTSYMPLELLTSPEKHPSTDMFSLGIMLYEFAADCIWDLPVDGKRWHELRSADHVPELPKRSTALVSLVKSLINPKKELRPNAENIVKNNDLVVAAGDKNDKFLSDYVKDVDEFEQKREKEVAAAIRAAKLKRFTPTHAVPSF